ncbi:MAG: hypothetical protein ACYDCO_11875 [Armatimonadota bacterium]
MRDGRAYRWQQFLVLGCLLMLFVPGWAQTRLPEEMLLNNVSLNSTYVEVLKRRGIPHFIGPAVTGMASVTALLKPAEPKQAPRGPATPGGLANRPLGPAAPPNTAPYGGLYGPAIDAPLTPAQPKKVGPYMIWRYDGNNTNGKSDPKATITTYVFFNERGVVEAVVVNQNNPKGFADIQTESGVTFGTKLSDIVKKYDWPDPFTRNGNFYYCYYPAQNVTFGLDTETRKVKCIGIGTSFIVTSQTLDASQETTVTPGSGMPGGLQPLQMPEMGPGAYMGEEDMPPGAMYGPPGEDGPGMRPPGYGARMRQ